MLHRRIVAVASWFVPRERRGDWRAEWDAEFAARERRPRTGQARRLELLRHSAGAVIDALFLRAAHWPSLRFLFRNWRITLTAGFSLAIAIAAMIVGLATWDALFHRPPGVADAERLRSVHFRTRADPFGATSYDDFRTIQSASRTFTAITAYPNSVSTLTLDYHGQRERLVATEVADDYFPVLGVPPRLGTLRLPRDDGPGRNSIVISEALWRRLGSDPTITGTHLRLNEVEATVAGVAPASFHGMLFVWNPDVWMSFTAAETLIGSPPALLRERQQRWLHLVGRIADGQSDEAAASEMNTLLAQIAKEHPAETRPTAIVIPTQTMPPDERSSVFIMVGTLIAVVLLMLLVACANVINLLLGLALARRYEFGVRAAIGASHWDLIVPQLRESLALTAIAGLAGFVAAQAALAWLSSFRPSVAPFFPPPSIDLRPGLVVAGITTVLVGLCGLVIGFAVAWRNRSDGLAVTINSAVTVTHSPRTRLRGALVLVQVSVATLVLVALAVAVSSLLRLQQAPLGFSERHLSFLGIDMRRSGYDEPHGPAFYDRIRARLERVPGVEMVSLVDGPPFGNGWGRESVSRADAPAGAGSAQDIRVSIVDDRYFATLGVALRAGRPFDRRDRSTSPEVAIVNETMARLTWPGEDPIGQRLRIARGNRVVTVVGVAADGKYEDPGERQLPFIYSALSQHYRDDIVAAVRTKPQGGPTLSTLADALHEEEPRLAFGGLGLMSLEDLLALPLFFSRAVAAMVGAVAVITLLLAVAGLYSSVFYSVNQRRQELAIRILLGAGPGHVFALALRSMAALALGGAIAGILAGTALLPVVSSMFYGIRPVEPLLSAAVAGGSLALVLVTTYLVVRPLTRAPSCAIERS